MRTALACVSVLALALVACGPNAGGGDDDDDDDGTSTDASVTNADRPDIQENAAVYALNSYGAVLGSTGRHEEGATALRESLDRSKRAGIDRAGFLAQQVRSETGIGASTASGH